MKYLKLSKTSWLILAAGVFVVVLAALGITRSQQVSEQGKLDEELSTSQTSLASIQIGALQAELENLQQAVDAGQQQLDDTVALLDQTVVSVDVTDKFFTIAASYGVFIVNLSTSPIRLNTYEGLGLAATSLNTAAEGALPNLIDFIEALNNDFTTGQIQTAQIDIPPSSSNETASASIQMTIYSYEGNEDDE